MMLSCINYPWNWDVHQGYWQRAHILIFSGAHQKSCQSVLQTNLSVGSSLKISVTTHYSPSMADKQL